MLYPAIRLGSWCQWHENHAPLIPCPPSSSYPGDWVAMFKMKVGQHEYKFNVDGKWKVAPGDPLVMDPEVIHWRGMVSIQPTSKQMGAPDC